MRRGVCLISHSEEVRDSIELTSYTSERRVLHAAPMACMVSAVVVRTLGGMMGVTVVGATHGFKRGRALELVVEVCEGARTEREPGGGVLVAAVMGRGGRRVGLERI